MNNEEKILSMLGQINSKQDRTETLLDTIAIEVSKLHGKVDKLDQRTLKTEIMIENTVLPQIQLLAEGHTLIQEQIKRLSVIDAMQDDIAILKTAFKSLSIELEQLKNAM